MDRFTKVLFFVIHKHTHIVNTHDIVTKTIDNIIILISICLRSYQTITSISITLYNIVIRFYFYFYFNKLVFNDIVSANLQSSGYDVAIYDWMRHVAEFQSSSNGDAQGQSQTNFFHLTLTKKKNLKMVNLHFSSVTKASFVLIVLISATLGEYDRNSIKLLLFLYFYFYFLIVI